MVPNELRSSLKLQKGRGGRDLQGGEIWALAGIFSGDGGVVSDGVCRRSGRGKI